MLYISCFYGERYLDIVYLKLYNRGGNEMKASHVLGTITIVAIIGGTIYAIKKSKDAAKAEGEEISLEEASKIVAYDQKVKTASKKLYEENKFNSKYEEIFKAGGTPKVTVGPIKIDGVTTYLEVKPYESEEFEDEDETEEPEYVQADFIENTHQHEGDEELRYEPNSREALSQFIKMELAEWAPLDDTHQTLRNLFEFPFKPVNDGDHLLRTQIIDYRAQFFGHASKWTKDVTIADIILHYARQAEFQVGENVKYWTEYFLQFNEVDVDTASQHIDDWINHINNHVYFNEERATFGLFGLTRESMDMAIRIANRNIDGSVTYEIEFQEFLKSCL